MAYERARPHRPRRWLSLRRVLLLSGAGVLICCIGAAGLGAWNLQSIRRASGPARQAADAFLTDLVTGDAAGAYDRLCSGTRQRWSRAEFIRRVGTAPRINRYALDDVSVATEDGHLKGTVTTRLTLDSGAVDRHKLTVVRDGDDWRVCGDPF